MTMEVRRSGGGERNPERLEIGRDTRREDADLPQIAHQPLMQVAAEEFAEGGLFAARGAVAAVLPDRFDVGLVEAHILVSAQREDAAQRAIERPDCEILHLAALGRARLGNNGGWRQAYRTPIAGRCLQ